MPKGVGRQSLPTRHVSSEPKTTISFMRVFVRHKARHYRRLFHGNCKSRARDAMATYVRQSTGVWWVSNMHHDPLGPAQSGSSRRQDRNAGEMHPKVRTSKCSAIISISDAGVQKATHAQRWTRLAPCNALSYLPSQPLENRTQRCVS